MSAEWVSARAVAWVIHDAPVPSGLAFTLTVIAARCDEHGRGSYQSVPTIAEKTGKSVDQARRDVERLVELGLVRRGDQSLVNHLAPGQRPVVYDVALELAGPKPAKESRNKSGAKKTTETPCMDATPRIHARGGMDAPSTPCMDAGTPLASMQGKQSLKNPLNNPSLGEPEPQTVAAVVSTVEEREDHQGEDPTPPPTVPGVPADLVERVMASTTATAGEFVRIVEAARRDGIRTPGPWLRSKAGVENFQQRLDDLRAAPSAPRSGQPGVADYREAVRAACEHGTPGGADRCPLCRRQAPVQPPAAGDQALEVPRPRGSQEPAPEQDRSGTPTSGTSGRDAAIAGLRTLLADKQTLWTAARARTVPPARPSTAA